VIRLAGGEQQPVRVHGIRVPQPPPALYTDILTRRVGRVRLQYELRDDDRVGRYHYLAWQDKTGDVWRDLAKLLIDQGAARVAAGQFAEREEYLRAENAARAARRGLWATPTDLAGPTDPP
jgi:endonuclease YncB( thermonuclease family)